MQTTFRNLVLLAISVLLLIAAPVLLLAGVDSPTLISAAIVAFLLGAVGLYFGMRALDSGNTDTKA